MNDPSLSVLDNWLVNKVGDLDKVVEQLVAEGWVPVTPERQPYIVDLMPQLKTRLEAEGFIIVDKPVFAHEGVNYTVKTQRMQVEFAATDRAEDLPDVNAQLWPLLIGHLRADRCQFVFSVLVARTALLGYLPPTVMVCTRGARWCFPAHST